MSGGANNTDKRIPLEKRKVNGVDFYYLPIMSTSPDYGDKYEKAFGKFVPFWDRKEDEGEKEGK